MVSPRTIKPIKADPRFNDVINCLLIINNMTDTTVQVQNCELYKRAALHDATSFKTALK